MLMLLHATCVAKIAQISLLSHHGTLEWEPLHEAEQVIIRLPTNKPINFLV